MGKSEIALPGIGRIKIRRGRHIKMLSVRMAPGRGVWVNIPYGVSDRVAEEFVWSRKEWIGEQQCRLKVYEKSSGVGLGINTEVKTKFHVLKIQACEAVKSSYKIEGKKIVLYVPERANYGKIAPFVERFLLTIYKMECQTYLPGRVQVLADRYGFYYRRLSFRNNLSNWGSCSYEDNISLNIKLMKLPDEIIDYVILHELCHTVEKNHSDRFWSLMKKVCPDYVFLRARLKMYNTRI